MGISVANTHQRMARGVCIDCRDPSLGMTRCERCRARVNAARTIRYLSGKCYNCAADSLNTMYCDACRERRNAGYRARYRLRAMKATTPETVGTP